MVSRRGEKLRGEFLRGRLLVVVRLGNRKLLDEHREEAKGFILAVDSRPPGEPPSDG